MPQVNQNSTTVEKFENVADKWTEIFRHKVPNKTVNILKNREVLVMDLRDSDNNKLPANTQILLAGKTDTPVLPDDLFKNSYRPWYSIELGDQYNEENQGKLKIKLSKGYLRLLESHELSLWIKSSAVVDWDNSVLEVDVDEEPYREPARR